MSTLRFGRIQTVIFLGIFFRFTISLFEKTKNQKKKLSELGYFTV